MFCEKCGSPNNDGAKFCANCGAVMDTGVPEPAPQPAPEPIAEPAVEPAPAPAYAPAPEPAPAPAFTQQTYAPAYAQPQGYALPPRKRNIATPSKVMLILCSVLSFLSVVAFFIPFHFYKLDAYTTKFENVITIFEETFKSDLARVNGILLLIMLIIASVAAVAAIITAFLRFKAAGALALAAAVISFGFNFNYFFGFMGYVFNISTYEMQGSGYTPVPLFIFILSVAAIIVSALALSKYRLKK